MPISFGKPGFEMTKQERIAALVTMVGGPVRAATISGKTRGTIDYWRKDGSDPPLEAILPLCIEAGVSLDWVATGHQVRPDLADAALADSDLVPIKALPAVVGRRALMELAVSARWLDRTFELTPENARLAFVEDGGMEPLVPDGAAVIVDIRPGPRKMGLYLLEIGGELVARRLRRLPDGRTELVADAEPTWTFALADDRMAELQMHRIVWAGMSLV